MRPTYTGEVGTRTWLAVAWAAGALGSVLDWTTLYSLRYLLHAPLAVATGCGLALGNTLNFLVNRRFGFPEAGGAFGAQVLRYAASVGVLMAIHASAVTLCVQGFRIPLVVAKVACDLVLFALLLPILLKTFVFARAWKPVAPAAASI